MSSTPVLSLEQLQRCSWWYLSTIRGITPALSLRVFSSSLVCLGAALSGLVSSLLFRAVPCTLWAHTGAGMHPSVAPGPVQPSLGSSVTSPGRINSLPGTAKDKSQVDPGIEQPVLLTDSNVPLLSTEESKLIQENQEVWRLIPCTFDRFEASSLGRIRRVAYIKKLKHHEKFIPESILPQRIWRGRYVCSAYNLKQSFVHTLVVRAFFGLPNEQWIAKFKTTLEKDCSLSNLYVDLKRKAIGRANIHPHMHEGMPILIHHAFLAGNTNPKKVAKYFRTTEYQVLNIWIRSGLLTG